MLENVRKDTAFTLQNQFQDTGLRNRIRHLFVKPIEQLVSLDRCNDLYNHLPEKEDLQQFFGSILKALDGLIVVDLFQTDRRTLTRYMGADGATLFVNYTFLADNGSETVALPRTA